MLRVNACVQRLSFKAKFCGYSIVLALQMKARRFKTSWRASPAHTQCPKSSLRENLLGDVMVSSIYVQ